MVSFRSFSASCNGAKRLAGAAFLALAMVAVTQPATAQQAAGETGDFDSWLAGLRDEAASRGIGDETLRTALAGLEPIPRVLELDRRQPEFTQTFWTYLERSVSDTRIQRGRDLLDTHAVLLDRIYREYGVQPRFLVSFWGLETNFGDYTGGFPVIGALATLAHDPRRADFFRNELFNALTILDQGHIALDQMSGSWAGAMGQPQFMPSTFTAYAIDGDGDGRIDIWNSLPDVFASAAHYLSSVGWNGEETWGREVQLPTGFDIDLTGLETRRHIRDWAALGVRRANGAALPDADIEGSIVLPAGASGPAFLVYGNFRATMVWNRSILYALAVGHLADRMIGIGRLVAERPADDAPLSRADIISLQSNLNRLGFDAGPADGIAGSGTRSALRDYQRARGLVPDGYPTAGLVKRLAGE